MGLGVRAGPKAGSEDRGSRTPTHQGHRGGTPSPRSARPKALFSASAGAWGSRMRAGCGIPWWSVGTGSLRAATSNAGLGREAGPVGGQLLLCAGPSTCHAVWGPIPQSHRCSGPAPPGFAGGAHAGAPLVAAGEVGAGGPELLGRRRPRWGLGGHRAPAATGFTAVKVPGASQGAGGPGCGSSALASCRMSAHRARCLWGPHWPQQRERKDRWAGS